MQSRNFVRSKRAGLAKGMNPRPPQRLDVIDVPDARDRTLIQEQHLDRRSRSPPQERAKPRDREAARQGLLPERGVQGHPRAASLAVRVERRRVDDRHASELARIREPHRGPVLEPDLAAYVALVHVRDAEEELARHAERDDQGLAAVEIEHHELAAASDVSDAPPAQPRADDLRRLRLGEADPARLERADRAVDDEPAQLPRDGLDLR